MTTTAPAPPAPWPTADVIVAQPPEAGHPEPTKPPAESEPPRRHAKRRWVAPLVLYVASFAVYLVVGMILTLHYHLITTDGPSRVANASYVIFSRFPHLAAVGFVWNPLPSLVEVPILAFKGWWPALFTQAQAGTIMSALFMAGAVVQIRGITVDRRLSRPWQVGLVLGFAVNPMVVLYAGNGMSEASYIFFSVWAVRRLLRWIYSDRVNDLVIGAVALGLGYLCRYEVAAAAIGAVVLVLIVRLLRSPWGRWRRRWRAAGLDAVIVALPFAFAFVAWALAGWITTGVAFAQFSSSYGNSSVVSIASTSIAAYKASAGGPLDAILRDLLGMAPLLPVALVVGVVLAVLRRDKAVAVPIAIFGAELAFETYANLSGSVFLWFRFWLMAIPLLVVVLATLVPAPDLTRTEGRSAAVVPSWTPEREAINPRWARAVLALLAVVCLLFSFVSTWRSMLNPAIGDQEFALRSIVNPAKYPPMDELQLRSTSSAQALAEVMDNMHLPRATVLMDTFQGWNVWLSSTNLSQYVITSDYDFVRDLNSPARYGIRYILVSDPKVDAGVDAVNSRYPSIWRNGAGICTPILSINGDGYDPSWRICRVNR